MVTSTGDSRVRATRSKDAYRAFYTSDDRLVDYMVNLLAIADGSRCLEPAAGDGCFIRGLLRARRGVEITAWELRPETASHLARAFAAQHSVTVHEGNFLLARAGGEERFDRIIANPPYGAWQTPELRKHLKRIYPSLYVKETYGLFLAASLARLSDGGRLVFIVPETFLYLHRQHALRALLLGETTIQSIDVLPSSAFPGVSFGYARLCIIVADRAPAAGRHTVAIRHSSSVDDLARGGQRRFDVRQADVFARKDHTFPLDGAVATAHFIDSAPLRLGELADCVTGFYSGDDRRFLRAASEMVKGARRYDVVGEARIHDGVAPPLSGIPGPRHFVPILKGGGHPYRKPVSWFVDWSRAAVAHYQRDSKARFQNSRYYFQRGIGLPMVQSSRSTASVIEPRWLFDQSIVGVFPRAEAHYHYLLSFLNSTTCFRLLRALNPSANNSAKYVRDLPIVLPDAGVLRTFDRIVAGYLDGLERGGDRDPELERRLDEDIAGIYGELTRSIVGSCGSK